MDFSKPIENGYYTVVLPVKLTSNMWYTVDTFSATVWILHLGSVPTFLVTMGLADLFFWGHADWGNISGFVIRHMVPNSSSRFHCITTAYQRILISTWVWCMMLLVLAYSSNLTAMMAKPKLQKPIRTFEELLGQDQISWVVEEGGLPQDYMSKSQPGSLMNRLLERARIIPRDQTSLQWIIFGKRLAAI